MFMNVYHHMYIYLWLYATHKNNVPPLSTLPWRVLLHFYFCQLLLTLPEYSSPSGVYTSLFLLSPSYSKQFGRWDLVLQLGMWSGWPRHQSALPARGLGAALFSFGKDSANIDHRWCWFEFQSDQYSMQCKHTCTHYSDWGLISWMYTPALSWGRLKGKFLRMNHRVDTAFLPDVTNVQVLFQNLLHLHTQLFDVIYFGYHLVVEFVRGGAGHWLFYGGGEGIWRGKIPCLAYFTISPGIRGPPVVAYCFSPLLGCATINLLHFEICLM